MCFSKSKKSSHPSSYETYDKIRLINSEYDESQRRYGQKPVRGDEIKILMSENFVKVTHKEFETPNEHDRTKMVLVDAPSSKSEKSDSERRRRSKEERTQYISIDKSSRDDSENRRIYAEKQSDYVGEVGLMSSYHSGLMEKGPLITPELDVLEAPYHEAPSSDNRLINQRSLGGTSSDKRFISQLDGVPVKEMIKIQTPDSYSALKSAGSIVEKVRSHTSSSSSRSRYKLIVKSPKTFQADEETLLRVNYKDLEKTRKRCIDRKMTEMNHSERILFLFHMPLTHRRIY